MKIYIYLVDQKAQSEINNLDGETNIFLDKNQDTQKLWYDFIMCLQNTVNIKEAKKFTIALNKRRR